MVVCSSSLVTMERKRLVKYKVTDMGLLFVFSFVLLVGTVSCSGFNSRIDDLSANLNRAINKALTFDNISYVKYEPNDTYVMRVVFDPKGMAGLYNITTFFMDLVLPKGIYPKGEFFILI